MVRQVAKVLLLVVVLGGAGMGCFLSEWYGASVVEDVTPPSYQECMWAWATDYLEDESARLQAALDERNIPYREASASAYGENCLDGEGNISYFAAMETDFNIVLIVDSLNDSEVLDNLEKDVLSLIVTEFPVDSTPGPQPGRITLTFEAGDETETITIQQNEAEALGAG